jgi:hypothetical protein
LRCCRQAEHCQVRRGWQFGDARKQLKSNGIDANRQQTTLEAASRQVLRQHAGFRQRDISYQDDYGGAEQGFLAEAMLGA